MAIFSRYACVLEPDDAPMTVRSALSLINEELGQILLGEIGGVDAETHFALSWFDENGYADGQYTRADVVLRAKNASIEPLVRSGVIVSESGRVRLLQPQEITAETNIELRTAPAWSQAMHVVAALVRADGSDENAAAVLRILGLGNIEHIKDIAYHCYLVCDRARRSTEARDFNAVVQAWPDLVRLASERGGDMLL
jgi:putative DNA methylase